MDEGLAFQSAARNRNNIPITYSKGNRIRPCSTSMGKQGPFSSHHSHMEKGVIHIR